MLKKQTSAQIKVLLQRRAQELAYYLALEAILTADIEIRRQLEIHFHRIGMNLESTRVERERDRIQQQAREILVEMDGIVELWMKALEDE